MAQEATLLFGVGATKSGTSWLHDYLVSHPEAVTPPHQDMHYFDSLSGDVPPFSIEMMQATIGTEIRALRRRLLKAAPDRQRPINRRIGRLQDLRTIYVEDSEDVDSEAYRRYIAFEFARSGAKVASDLTPSYGLLSDAWLQRLAAIMPVTRFVYIMRDPVDRLWSSIRMVAQKTAETVDDVTEHCMNIVDKILVNQNHSTLAFADYASVLDKLDRNIPEKNRMTMFFENMFTQKMMDAFCKFLGISEHPAKIDNRSSQGISLRLDDARRRGLSEILAPQYAAVEARFGSLPDRWQQNMTKV